MKELLREMTERARPLGRSVVFPDSGDVRTLRAAAELRAGGVLRPILVGAPNEIRSAARREGIDLREVEIEDPGMSGHRPRLVEEFAALRPESSGGGVPPGEALREPLTFAGMMVRCGLADGSVAGSVSRTSDVIRAAIRTIGMREGVARVSGYFLMLFPGGPGRPGRTMAFADCAVQPEPDAEGLAEIGRLTAENYSAITGIVPVVAFLSFSTRGSAVHPSVEKVREATALFRRTRPGIAADGELQLDAAVDPAVAGLKAPGSEIAGAANVLVFPDLNAGNIGYKIAQRLGGATALGPILQGLAKPAFDLSRGCSVDDIILVSVINALSAV